jgi:hypothetical protein
MIFYENLISTGYKISILKKKMLKLKQLTVAPLPLKE